MQRRFSKTNWVLPAAVVLLIATLTGVPAAHTEEAYLVNGFYRGTSVFDLATSDPIETIYAGSDNFSVSVGPNPRLAFVSAGLYLSVVDLTIQREIKRLPDVPISRFTAFTPDGRFLLVTNNETRTLDFIDVAQLKNVRKVSLLAAIGYNFFSGFGGSIVVIGNKAYVTPKNLDPTRPAIAVVDLHTFVVSSIAIPYGTTQGGFLCRPNAAATPDGKYLVMIQGNHLLFLNTSTNQVTVGASLGGAIYGIAVTPNGLDPNYIYGYLVRQTNHGAVASVIDLRPNSQAFGQLIAGTDVSLALGSYGIAFSGLAINASGSKLVIAGQQMDPNVALPNVLVLDTALMLTNPNAAIVGESVALDGGSSEGATIASIVTSPPPTAPVVTGISGNVTNDVATTIHIYGSNFAPGALVHIGSMGLLPTTFISSTDLTVTIPKNAPAAPNQDVIVTNPNLQSAPALQNQSGLLAGGLTISAATAFQPQYQIATNFLDGSVQVLDLQQRSMVSLPPSNSVFPGLAFNMDGAELYGLSFGPPYWPSSPQAPEWKLADNSLQGIVGLPDTVSADANGNGLLASINPLTQAPIVYAPASSLDSNYIADLQLLMIDTNPASQTFNTIVRTLNAGLNLLYDFFEVTSLAATPDGKYVYVNYLDGNANVGMLAIFDVMHGGPATVMTMSSLAADDVQYFTQVAPDSKSLLLESFYSQNGAYGEEIKVFDIGANPKLPVFVTAITAAVVTRRSTDLPYLYSFQATHDRLFALEAGTGSVIAFNFDRAHSNFNQLGAYCCLSDSYANLAVSPDGALVYVPEPLFDSMTVLDGTKLANRQPSLVTKLATNSLPFFLTVSPLQGGSRHSQRIPQADDAKCCSTTSPVSGQEARSSTVGLRRNGLERSCQVASESQAAPHRTLKCF